MQPTRAPVVVKEKLYLYAVSWALLQQKLQQGKMAWHFKACLGYEIALFYSLFQESLKVSPELPYNAFLKGLASLLISIECSLDFTAEQATIGAYLEDSGLSPPLHARFEQLAQQISTLTLQAAALPPLPRSETAIHQALMSACLHQLCPPA